jgi:hypothetical protein
MYPTTDGAAVRRTSFIGPFKNVSNVSLHSTVARLYTFKCVLPAYTPRFLTVQVTCGVLYAWLQRQMVCRSKIINDVLTYCSTTVSKK